MSSLREIIDEQLVSDYMEQKSTPTTCWRISGLGMPWDNYHARAGSPVDEFDPWDLARGEFSMSIGTYIHELVNDLVRKSGAEIIFMDTKDPDDPERFEVRDGDAVGHPDIGLLIDGKAILYDIKTINSNAFTHMKKEGGGKIKAYPHHVKQITKYFDLVTKEFPQYDWEMRLFYVARDDGRREEIPVPFDPGILGEANAEFAYLDECWAKQEPPAPPAQDSFQYKYSKYQHLCGYPITDKLNV